MYVLLRKLRGMRVQSRASFTRMHNYACTCTGGSSVHLENVKVMLLTLGAHAQRGLQYLVCVSVCLFVCLSVCLSVDDYSRTTGYEAAYERYQQLQCYKGMKINVAILLKRLRSRDMA